MHTAPLVSIIVISKDRPDLLERALNSIYAQTYRPLEIVLLDNQSSPPIPTPKAPDGIVVKSLRSPNLMNASASRNFGIDQSSGDYIAFLDDDDYYLPNRIAQTAEVLKAKLKIDIAYMNTQMLSSEGKKLKLLRGNLTHPR